MFRILLCLLVMWSLSSCDYYLINPHKHQVGHISESAFFDKSGFKACFEERMFPYYYGRNPSKFSHGKDSLKIYFHQYYDHFGYTNESGYITIQFIINCEGETGRHQVLQVGLDYQEKEFNHQLTDKLLQLTKNLKDWDPISFSDTTYDSFIHLTFKIENGELVEILP